MHGSLVEMETRIYQRISDEIPEIVVDFEVNYKLDKDHMRSS